MPRIVLWYIVAVSWWDAVVTRPLANAGLVCPRGFKPRPVGRHRLGGRPRPFDREDYEWGRAIKAMAARMEARNEWR